MIIDSKSFRTLVLASAAFALALVAPAQAAALDAEGELTCAAMAATSCTAADGCEHGMPSSVNAPEFFKIDFEKQQISVRRAGQEGGNVTKIARQEVLDELILLQGIEHGRAWGVSIHRDNGRMTLTATADELGFVLFGACIAD